MCAGLHTVVGGGVQALPSDQALVEKRLLILRENENDANYYVMCATSGVSSLTRRSKRPTCRSISRSCSLNVRYCPTP